MTQLLTLIAMEAPTDMGAAAIRAEKVKALKSIPAVSSVDVLAGQVSGYLDLDGVALDSKTATFAALRISIDNWRWQGVPFLMRTGKELRKQFTRITVRYRMPPVCLFHSNGSCPGHQNMLHITLQPDEGFDLFFDIKQPGDRFGIAQIPLSVRYDDWLDDLPDAYHTLLLDVLEGDQTLFVNAEEVEESWRIYDDVLDPDRVEIYEPGRTGPPGSAEFAGWRGGEWSEI